LRHVPSGKYLAVDSTTYSKIGSGNEALGVSFYGDLDVLDEDTSAVMMEAEYYSVSLVSEGNVNVEEGKPGSPSSIIFYLVATDITKNTLQV
jgi:hypothetical protein